MLNFQSIRSKNYSEFSEFSNLVDRKFRVIHRKFCVFSELFCFFLSELKVWIE